MMRSYVKRMISEDMERQTRKRRKKPNLILRVTLK
jgi:hypothetical protein